MTNEEGLEIVKKALNALEEGKGNDITLETDLMEEDIIDSLDSMSMLFEIENEVGSIVGIDEDYSDFKVSSLVDLIVKSSK